jgi:small-conductance mechanosensitive channel
MDTFWQILRDIKSFLEVPLVKMGDTTITLWFVLYFILVTFLLIYLSGKLKKLMVRKILSPYIADIGVRQAIGSIIRYVVMILGFIILVQAAGINLSTLTVLFGALGVGIGFGLQTITNNFVSGIIILFERPIKEGDRIEVGGTHGRVTKVSARATTILTNDNIAIIVPNSEFIAGRVINWSYNDIKVRFRVPVSVDYSSDIFYVEKILLEVAKENKDVLEVPEPRVLLTEFGDNGIHMELRVWSSSLIHYQGRFKSDINYGIYRKFKEHNITIPFPQRDIHFKSDLPSAQINVNNEKKGGDSDNES